MVIAVVENDVVMNTVLVPDTWAGLPEEWTPPPKTRIIKNAKEAHRSASVDGDVIFAPLPAPLAPPNLKHIQLLNDIDAATTIAQLKLLLVRIVKGE